RRPRGMSAASAAREPEDCDGQHGSHPRPCVPASHAAHAVTSGRRRPRSRMVPAAVAAPRPAPPIHGVQPDRLSEPDGPDIAAAAVLLPEGAPVAVFVGARQLDFAVIVKKTGSKLVPAV